MANPPPLISIVLPTYNRAHLLSQAVESCRQQTYPHWELIIVDDAATDETPQLIAAFCARDARIRAVRHDRNRRLPHALNTGFALAQGALLTWTSDDDLFRPVALERLVAACAAYPDADFVYTDYDVVDGDGAYVQTNVAPAPHDLIFGKERVACFIYRRAIYAELGDYAEDLFLAEDYDYLLRILNSRFRMMPLHENLYQYRRHSTSLTDVYRGQTFHAAEQALSRNFAAMRWANRAQRGEARLHLASLALWQKKRGRAMRYTLQGIALAPSHALRKVISYGRKRFRRNGA